MSQFIETLETRRLLSAAAGASVVVDTDQGAAVVMPARAGKTPRAADPMTRDTAGAKTATARRLGVLRPGGSLKVWEFVGRRDGVDFFSFSVPQATDARLSLRNLKADADVSVFDGAGRRVARSEEMGTKAESLAGRIGAGTYYVAVRAYSGNTHYTLELSAKATPRPAPTPVPVPRPGPTPAPGGPNVGGLLDGVWQQVTALPGQPKAEYRFDRDGTGEVRRADGAPLDGSGQHYLPSTWSVSGGTLTIRYTLAGRARTDTWTVRAIDATHVERVSASGQRDVLVKL